MKAKTCTYCGQQFFSSRYHPDQKICTSPECQRRRRTDYHRRKISVDPTYRDQCHDSQGKWREKNPAYMRRYRAKHRSKDRADPEKARLVRNLRRFHELAKNNVVLDLRSLDATIWLLCPERMADVKNTFAKAKLLVIEAVMFARGLGEK